MTNTDEARRIYDDSIVIDGLNVSNWDSPAVFESLSGSGTTAINATVATWEGFLETVDNLARWDVRLRQRADTIAPVRTVDDILAARDRLVASGARVLGGGEPSIGSHGKPILFLHPKDFLGTLIELEQA